MGEQMRRTAAGMVGKRPPYAELVAAAAAGTLAESDRVEPC